MIKISNVSKYYYRAVALSSVCIEIPDGQVVGIVGENGAGKTTLLKAMAGLVSLNYGGVS